MITSSIARRAVALAAAFALAIGLMAAAPPQLANAVDDAVKALDGEVSFPATVSADGLPTAQIDGGVVWDVLVVGNTVYAGGEFSNARPAGAAPGTSLVPRSNLLAIDIRTGELLPFAPTINARVNDIAVSPDGRRLYVAGTFTQVNGQSRTRLAAFDLPSHTLSAAVAPVINGTAQSVIATDAAVYVGGYFSAVNGQSRPRLAAVSAANGQTMPFNPVIDDGQVQGLTMNPEGTKLVLSGNFTSVANGQSSPGYGLAMVDPVTGGQLALPVNSSVRNGGTQSGVTNLASDGEHFYGVGYHFGSGGNMEGAFSARWSDGTLVWVEDCHGDTYGIAPAAGLVYMASHKHYCGNSGSFPQTDPWELYYSTVVTPTVEGVNTPDIYGYPDHAGEPRPEILPWYPTTDAGTVSGQSVWAVGGNDRFVVYGGEFRNVNGQTQQGLVRYTLREDAPNKQGPRLTKVQARQASAAGQSGAQWWTPNARSVVPGSLRVTFPTIWDIDDRTLTYRVYVDSVNSSGLVDEQTMSNDFWDVRTMRATVDGLEPGSTHRVLVTASDPYGNEFRSGWASVTVAAGTVSPYVQTLARDDVRHLWRLGESNGPSSDVFGGNAMTLEGALLRNQAGAIADDPDDAIAFEAGKGPISDGAAGASASQPGSQRFSIETWFKTTTTSGGKIVGFGNSRTGTSSTYDRHLYMNNAGQVYFGVHPGAVRTVNTPQTYRDGEWHHVVATLSDAGMRLYVDGALAASRDDVTAAQSYSGYWRLAGDNLNGWTGSPSSTLFEGSLDETAIYDEALPADRVAAHFTAGTTGAPPNESPTATFAEPTITGLDVAVVGSGQDTDGSVVSLEWDFGDGSTATGAEASHTYAAAGTYTITLSVTDDDGASGTATRSVSVEPLPNVAPEAVFSSSVDGLSMSTDASGSSDSDGTIASYEWDFGDGYVAGAATASFEFAAAGTYPVSLRVTDDEGATDEATANVTVFDPGSGVLAADEFERSESNGWGAADLGGDWTVRGTASRFSVGDGVGKIAIPASVGQTVYADLNGVSSASTRVDAVFSVSSQLEAQYVSVVARQVGSDTYVARVRTQANGGARLYLLQQWSSLAPMVQLPFDIVPGGQYNIAVEVTGTSPTTVRAKVWPVGETEPAWQAEGTNSLAALQAPGSISVFTYVPNSPTGGGVAFERIAVTDPSVGE